jgi:cyclopropane fatty-acyl-phospholipid synthase-like methyltransferase
VTVSRASEFAGVTCTAPAARSDRMRDIVVSHVPSGRPIRMLDVGCGTGSLVFRLAAALPDATLIGIDVSAPNIEAARRELSRRRPAPAVQFERADYLGYAAAPFDAIVSDGVLHLIVCETGALVRKLARDLRPGGVLVIDMAYDGAYNRAFSVVRRLLRVLRSSWLDHAILQAGRLLHGRDMDEAGLRERIGYMYMPPVRMNDARLMREFADAGLHRVTEYPMAATSLSQLRHRVTILERRDGDEPGR